MRPKLADFLDEKSRRLLGVVEGGAKPEVRRFPIDENDRLLIQLNSDEKSRRLFLDCFFWVYASLRFGLKEQKRMNENPKAVEAGFLEVLSFHLERSVVRPRKTKKFEVEIVDSDEIQEMFGKLIKLGKSGYHFFDNAIIPLYLRINLSSEDKNKLIDDFDNLKLSFRSFLCACAGRKSEV